jgi:hypothetical protein
MVMATRTAAQSGLWGDTATWGGTVPVNGDAFNIPPGITVECDVDQSSMATGMAASVLDGILHFKPDVNTCLKMNGNITGTGALYIAHRASVTGWTLATGYSHVYEAATSVWVMEVEESLGVGYGKDAREELIETAIDVENAARRAQGLNEMMPDAVQEFIETTRAALTLSDYLEYVEATPGSFYCDKSSKTYIHTSDSSDPDTKTITLIDCIQRPAAGSEYRCYLLWNSSGTIAMTGTPIIRAYGGYPEREWTQLAADAASGQNQIVLEHDLEIQAGFILGIGCGNNPDGLTEAATGIYTIQSYDSGTKTVTLTANLQTNRNADDLVVIISKAIKVNRTSGNISMLTASNAIDNVVIEGLNSVYRFAYTANPAFYYSNWKIKHCTCQTGYPLLSYGLNSIVKDCVGIGPLNYGLIINSPGTVVKRCATVNGVSAYSGNSVGNMQIDSVIEQNAKYGSYASMVKNSVYKNANFEYRLQGILKNSKIFSQNTLGTILGPSFGLFADGKIIDCIFEDNNLGYLEDWSGKLSNCLFEGQKEILNYTNPKRPANKVIESFDHNQQPGNYKAWMRGGKIETALDGSTILPGRLILHCESADYPVFRDFPVLLPAYRTSTWQALTKKSFTGGSVKIELIDPANDPLIDPSAQPLATYSLLDQADTNLPLKLGYKSDKAMLAILRVTAQNSTGTVEVDTRLIENRIQHGQ